MLFFHPSMQATLGILFLTKDYLSNFLKNMWNNGSFIFFYFFWGVCGVVCGPGIRLDCFFSESLQQICFLGTTQISFLASAFLSWLCLLGFLCLKPSFFSPKNSEISMSSSHWGSGNGIRQGWWFGSEKLRWKRHQPTNQPTHPGMVVGCAKKTHWIHGFWDTGIAWFEGMQMFFLKPHVMVLSKNPN